MPHHTTPEINGPSGPIIKLKLAQIRIDGGTQPRVDIDTDVAADYAERMKAGDEFPPVDVFFDDTEYWLADGFHRYHGASSNAAKRIACTVRKGSRRDAILFACGANGRHGQQRTNADKRKAVETLLADEEWKKFSDGKIADLCAVSQPFVSERRRELKSDLSSSSEVRRIGRDGKKRVAGKPKPAVRLMPAPASPKCNHLERDGDGDCVQCLDPAPERQPCDNAHAISAEKSKRGATGKGGINSKHRHAAIKAFGVVVRFIDRLGDHDNCRTHLDAILRAIKGAGA